MSTSTINNASQKVTKEVTSFFGGAVQTRVAQPAVSPPVAKPPHRAAVSLIDSMKQWGIYSPTIDPKDPYAGYYGTTYQARQADLEGKSAPEPPLSFEAWRAKVSAAFDAKKASSPAAAPVAAKVAAAKVAPASRQQRRPAQQQRRQVPPRPVVAPRAAPAIAGSGWGNFAAVIRKDDAAGAEKSAAERALVGDVRPALEESYKSK